MKFSLVAPFFALLGSVLAAPGSGSGSDPNAVQPDPNSVHPDPNVSQPDPNAAQPNVNACPASGPIPDIAHAPDVATVAFYSFDYDNPASSTNIVACSNGPHGLSARFPTLGKIPTFPNIGGSNFVTGWGSPMCGSCWQITAQGKPPIFFTAIDTSGVGFDLSFTTFRNIGGQAGIDAGRINITAVEVAASKCGL